MFTPFQNEPYVNFSEERPRRKMEEALARVSQEMGRTYPLVIGGQKLETQHKTTSYNPAHIGQVVGNVCDGSSEMAERAVRAATEAFPAWSRLPFDVRARYLVKAAAIMRRRIYEFSAWMVVESSKNWNEAYADAAEAVDFLEFYAREAVRWGQPHPTTPYPGEENEVQYLPIGVGGVIAPWNFPLAILCGMTAAAIVTGNTVIMKPAEQTPVIAAKFFELLESVNLPPGVVNFVPGPGEIVGETLTGHPGVRFVSFTGSREVGLHIHERIAVHQPGQKFLKKGVLEMGGKDAIIVDEDVNLDAAAMDVVASAFGFQGQKCSACSRLIAHTKIYDALLAKVVERASRLTVGDPTHFSNYMGAVIDEGAYQKILKYIAIGRNEGRVVLGGDDTEEMPEGGYFIHPDHHCRCGHACPHRAGRDFRPGPDGAACQRFQPCSGDRQQHGVCADGGRLQLRPRPSGARPARVPCRQPVSEPQMHGRARGCAAVRWLQYERHGQQSGRARLSGPLPAGQVRLRAVVK